MHALISLVVSAVAASRLKETRSLWVLIALLAGPAIGLAVLAEKRGSVPGLQAGFLVLPALAITASFVEAFATAKSVRVPRRSVSTAPGVTIVATLTLAACAHFALGGIPLLSGNVEVARLNVNSGLFGIPGRLTLYGYPILVIPIMVMPQMFGKRAVRIFWAAALLSRILLGFKSGLLSLAAMAAIGWIIKGVKIRPKTAMYAAIAIVGGSAAALAIGAKYGSLGPGGLGLNYWRYRVTESASEASWYAFVQHYQTHHAFFFSDLAALIDKYLGTSYATMPYTTEQLIAAQMTGTHVGSGVFLGSVTVGGAAYLPLAFTSSVSPVTIAVAGSALGAGLGAIWQIACISLRRNTTGLVCGLLAAGTILAVRDFMTNGGLAYILLNYGFTAAALMAVAGTVRWLQRAVEK